MALGIQSINKPAPRWYRITKKMVNLLTNATITILMIEGRRADDGVLLIIKLAQSFAMDTLDTFMSNGEVYAKEDTVEVSATFKTVAAPKDDELQNKK